MPRQANRTPKRRRPRRRPSPQPARAGGPDPRLRLQPDAADALVAAGPDRADRGGGAHALDRRRAARRGDAPPSASRRDAAVRAAGRAGRRHARHQGRRSCASSATSSPRAACGRGWSTSPPAASPRPAMSRRRRSRSTTARGGAAVFGADRGASVAAMADAFANWLRRQGNVAGIISAGGSGGASLVAPAMRTLPVGVPKLIDLLGRLGRRRPLCRPRRHHDDVFGHRRAGPQFDLAHGARQRRATPWSAWSRRGSMSARQAGARS